jgi:hypothetical protein
MSSVPSRVVELIETFDRNIEAYHSQQYNETQLRREFIDPFFSRIRLGRNEQSRQRPRRLANKKVKEKKCLRR